MLNLQWLEERNKSLSIRKFWIRLLGVHQSLPFGSLGPLISTFSSYFLFSIYPEKNVFSTRVVHFVVRTGLISRSLNWSMLLSPLTVRLSRLNSFDEWGSFTLLAKGPLNLFRNTFISSFRVCGYIQGKREKLRKKERKKLRKIVHKPEKRNKHRHTHKRWREKKEVVENPFLNPPIKEDTHLWPGKVESVYWGDIEEAQYFFELYRRLYCPDFIDSQ